MNCARKITYTDYYNNVPYACPREARLLQVWSSVSTLDDYVDSLTPSGNTYHDIGLLWGARLMSPTGIFASDNAFTPNGGPIQPTARKSVVKGTGVPVSVDLGGSRIIKKKK